MTAPDPPKPPPAPPAPRRPLTQRRRQRRGLVIACCVGALFVAVVGWFVANSAIAPTAPPPEIPNIPAAPRHAHASTDPSQVDIGAGEGVHIDLVDRKDPRRTAGILMFPSTEPLEGRRWVVQKPEARLFLRDGRTLVITADEGNLYMPDRGKEPESGTIRGNVVMRLFEPREDGRRIDPATDTPSGTLRTDSLSFDSTLGELTTPDQVSIASDQIDFVGTGLRIVFNQVKERLEFLRIEQGDRLVVRSMDRRQARAKPSPPPASPPPPKQPGAAPQPAGQTPVAAAPATPPTPPPQTLYRIDFKDGVAVTHQMQRLDAELLQVWARLIDNKLPENAIAPIRTAALDAKPAAAPVKTASPAPDAPPPGSAHATVESPQPEKTAIAASPAAPSTGASDAEPVEITLAWTGPCEITPLDEAPDELKADHLFARFSSPASDVVGLSDAERSATGRTQSIAYGATTGKLLLIGEPSEGMFLDVPDAGRITAKRIEADLPHGLVHVPGPGRLTRSEHEHVAWSEQADFTFATRDGALVNALKQAAFQKDVDFVSPSGFLRGGFARADFITTPQLASSLSRLIVEDDVEGKTRDGAGIKARKIDAAFTPSDKGDPEIRQFTAIGRPIIERDGDRIEANRIEATMANNAKGDPDIVTAAANGDVIFSSRKEGVLATSDEMRGDFGWTGLNALETRAGRRQIVDLIGPASTITRTDPGSGTTRISGPQMRLNGVTQGIQVYGAGEFEHANPDAAVVNATWKGGMSFDDSTGEMESFGDAAAISMPDPLSKDTVRAERIRLWLTPRGETPAESAAGEQDQQNEQNEIARRLIRAEATGSVLEREGGTNAVVQSEKFAPDEAAPGGKRREQLQYLEGPRIIADNREGTLDVPASGRLLLVDRRPPPSPSREREGQTEARGDALFEWDGSLHMKREAGQATMNRNVRLTHRGATDRQITNLTCDSLEANVDVPDSAQSGAAPRGSLKSVKARGAVFATVGPETPRGQKPQPRKELVADEAVYDALTGMLEAAANHAAQVTFFDPGSGSPIHAGSLLWDTRTDRIEIRRPSPIVAPR